jgi:hypothetical protein
MALAEQLSLRPSQVSIPSRKSLVLPYPSCERNIDRMFFLTGIPVIRSRFAAATTSRKNHKKKSANNHKNNKRDTFCAHLVCVLDIHTPKSSILYYIHDKLNIYIQFYFYLYHISIFQIYNLVLYMHPLLIL